MKKYNKIDVQRLEEWYLELRPYVENHPSVSLIDNRPDACPKCGGGPMIIIKKRKYAKVGWAMQYQCRSCGGYSTQRLRETANVQFVN